MCDPDSQSFLGHRKEVDQTALTHTREGLSTSALHIQACLTPSSELLDSTLLKHLTVRLSINARHFFFLGTHPRFGTYPKKQDFLEKKSEHLWVQTGSRWVSRALRVRGGGL